MGVELLSSQCVFRLQGNRKNGVIVQRGVPKHQADRKFAGRMAGQ